MPTAMFEERDRVAITPLDPWREVVASFGKGHCGGAIFEEGGSDSTSPLFTRHDEQPQVLAATDRYAVEVTTNADACLSLDARLEAFLLGHGGQVVRGVICAGKEFSQFWQGVSVDGADHGVSFAIIRDMDSDVVRCSSCGQLNRVPAGKKAVCGKCKSALGGHPITLTDADFRSTISSGSYVVDFWAPWCGPCRMISPILEQLAAERSDVRFAKINVDENTQSARAVGVQGIPLLVFFKDGAERGRVVGAVPRPKIEAAIQQYLGN